MKYAVDKAEELHVKNIIDIEENSEFRDILIFVQGGGQVKEIIESLHLFNANVLDKQFNEVLKYIDDKPKSIIGGSNDMRYYIAPITLTRDSFTESGTEYQNLFSPIENIMIPIYNLDEKGVVNVKSIRKWIAPSRRIIVATNIAETGVTIETLKYCIDTGFVNHSEFNPDFGISSLFSKNITRGMALQRKGRVGRKSPGNWYPCYTEAVYNSLNIDQFADILKSDVTIHLLGIIITETESEFIPQENLTLKELENKNKFFITNRISDTDYFLLRHAKPFNLSTVDLFESPSSSSLIYSMEKLYSLGFIDSQYNPTILGMYSKNFSKLSLEVIKLILSGYSHGANIIDLITISAFISVGMRFIFTKNYKPINVLKPKVSNKEYEFYYKTIICCQFVECLLVWNLYSEFLNDMMEKIRKKANKNTPYKFSISKIHEWCDANNISYNGLIAISKVRDEILSSMISLGFNPYYNGLGLEKGSYNLLKIIKNNLEDGVNEIKKIKKCIIDSYKLNLIIWDNINKTYVLNHRNIPVHIVKNNLISQMGDDAVQKNAIFIIAENVMLSESKNTPGIYEFNVSNPISIIDSLDIDIKFLLH
jgi:HrpA-like RNA helicase